MPSALRLRLTRCGSVQSALARIQPAQQKECAHSADGLAGHGWSHACSQLLVLCAVLVRRASDGVATRLSKAADRLASQHPASAPLLSRMVLFIAGDIGGTNARLELVRASAGIAADDFERGKGEGRSAAAAPPTQEERSGVRCNSIERSSAPQPTGAVSRHSRAAERGDVTRI